MLYRSPIIVRAIKSRRLRWAGHVARMQEGRSAFKVLTGKPTGKRSLGRPRHRMDFKVIGRILIPGFIWSLPTLAVYSVVHSLVLGDVDWGFPFTEDDIQRDFSYLSGAVRESPKNKFFFYFLSHFWVPIGR